MRSINTHFLFNNTLGTASYYTSSHQLCGCLLKTCISFLDQNWRFLWYFRLLILRCCKEEREEPLWCGSWRSSIPLAGPPEDLIYGTGSQTAWLCQTSPGASLGGTCRNTEGGIFTFESICFFAKYLNEIWARHSWWDYQGHLIHKRLYSWCFL